MKRWLYYILVGLIFGVFDWFFLDWLSRCLCPNLGDNPFIVIPIIIGLNYGIWLVPIGILGGAAIGALSWWVLVKNKKRDRAASR